MKKIQYIIAIIFLSSGVMQAQSLDDGLRYSELTPLGTARTIGMAGSFGSLGGDISSVSINPAGIGVYRSSEFVVSMGFVNNSANTSYYDTKNSDYKMGLAFNSIGYVGNYLTGEESGLVSLNYSLTSNKVADFNKNFYSTGQNPYSSIVDTWGDYANGYAVDQLNPFMEGLAYSAYLLELDNFEPSRNIYYPYIWQFDHIDNGVPAPLSNYYLTQNRRLKSSGGIREYAFAMGANISHKLYFGGSLDIKRIKYYETIMHQELDTDPYVPFNNDFVYNYQLDVNGTGYSGKLGVIARPIKLIRLGVAFHMPTFYHINETRDAWIRSNVDGITETFTSDALIGAGFGVNDYNIVIPGKVVLSGGIHLLKFGVVNIDIESMDYSRTRYSSSDLDPHFDYVNLDVKEALGRVVNMKLGTELMINNFALRAGTAYYQSPFVKEELNEGSDRFVFSTGFGVRSESVYFDLGYSAFSKKSKVNLYNHNIDNSEIPNIVRVNEFNHTFLATIGFKF